MRFQRLLMLTAACLSWAGIASAGLKISLITVSPGPVIFSAFGHSSVLVEDSDKPGQAVLYEYGYPDPTRIFSNPDTLAVFQQIFDSKVVTRAKKASTPMVESVRVPLKFYAEYLTRKDAYRELVLDELALTQEQATHLVELMDKDIASGDYYYQNFTKNCATGVRDRLFDDAVLGKEARLELEAKVPVSLDSISMEALDEAVALSLTKSIQLMPANIAKTPRGRQALFMLKNLGMPPEFKSAKEFYAAVKTADERINMFMPESPLAASFHGYFFSSAMTDNPITTHGAIFTPKRMREALLKMKNPATGKPLIDPALANKRTSADAPPPPPAPPAAPAAIPMQGKE